MNLRVFDIFGRNCKNDFLLAEWQQSAGMAGEGGNCEGMAYGIGADWEGFR